MEKETVVIRPINNSDYAFILGLVTRFHPVPVVFYEKLDFQVESLNRVKEI